MRNFARSLPLITLILSVSVSAFAQGFKVESSSPPGPESSNAADTFVSLESQFSISLSKQVSGYEPVSSGTPQVRMTGDSFVWQTSEAKFSVAVFRWPPGFDDLARQKAFTIEYLKDIALKVDELRGKILSHRELLLTGHPGLEIILEFPTGSLIQRSYFFSPRIYRVSASVKSSDKIDNALKILNTFKLLSTLEVEAALQRKIKDAEPPPLPQEPIAKKLKSDLEDEGLKGKIKMIVNESSSFSEVNGKFVEHERTPSSTENYNELGNLVRSVSYDWKGNVRDITVYGYIDGDRASRYSFLSYEYDPPPMMMPPPPAGQAKPQYDLRYSQKFKFKYDDKGHLEEKAWYGNDGKLSIRYVYKNNGKQKELLVYSANGSRNERFSSILDDKGNELENTEFNIEDDSVRNKTSYDYEYDKKGNWIKRTASKWVTKAGNSFFEPAWVTYRAITYY